MTIIELNLLEVALEMMHDPQITNEELETFLVEECPDAVKDAFSIITATRSVAH